DIVVASDHPQVAAFAIEDRHFVARAAVKVERAFQRIEPRVEPMPRRFFGSSAVATHNDPCSLCRVLIAMQHIVVSSIDSGDPSLTDFHHGLLGTAISFPHRADKTLTV